MTRLLGAAGVVLLLAIGGCAAPVRDAPRLPAPDSMADGAQARAALAVAQAERSRLEAVWGAREAECRRRFFVSTCLDALGAERRLGEREIGDLEIAARARLREEAAIERNAAEAAANAQREAQQEQDRARAQADAQAQQSRREQAQARQEQQQQALQAAEQARPQREARERERLRELEARRAEQRAREARAESEARVRREREARQRARERERERERAARTGAVPRAAPGVPQEPTRGPAGPS